MGTTAQKGAYLNQTKSLLKDKINALGGSIDDETTFREYANQLDGIYEALPKIEFEEGESVTLENTLKGKLDFQDNIAGIGQASQESTDGYNIFNENAYNYSTIGRDRLSDLTKNANGLTLTTSSSASSTDYGRVLFSTSGMFDNTKQYLLSADVTLSQTSTVLLGWYSISNDNPLHENIPANIETHLTTAIPIGTNPTYLSVGVFGGGIIATFKNIQIVEGSTDKTYEPYTGGQASPNPSYEQEIKYVAGKNKWGGFSPFTKTQGGLTFTTNTDGSIDISGTATELSSSATIAEAIANNLFIKLEKGTYSVSGGGSNYVLQIYDKNANLIANIQSGTTSVTFTLTQTTEILCRVFIDNAGTNYNNVKVNLQLEERKCSNSIPPI